MQAGVNLPQRPLLGRCGLGCVRGLGKGLWPDLVQVRTGLMDVGGLSPNGHFVIAGLQKRAGLG